MPAVRFSMPASYRHQDEYLQLNDETAATGRRPIVLLDQNQRGAGHAGTLLIAAFLHFDLLDVVFGSISGGLSPVFFDTFACDLLNVVSQVPSTLRLTGNLVAPCPHSALEAPTCNTASSSARGRRYDTTAGRSPSAGDRQRATWQLGLVPACWCTGHAVVRWMLDYVIPQRFRDPHVLRADAPQIKITFL